MLPHRFAVVSLSFLTSSGFNWVHFVGTFLLHFTYIPHVCSISGRARTGAVLLVFTNACDTVLCTVLRLVLEHIGLGKNVLQANKTFCVGSILLYDSGKGSPILVGFIRVIYVLQLIFLFVSSLCRNIFAPPQHWSRRMICHHFIDFVEWAVKLKESTHVPRFLRVLLLSGTADSSWFFL